MAILAARHPETMAAFRAGLSAVFKMWTALELALFHQWGGQQGGEAASDLQEELIDMFALPERMYKDDVAIVIEDYMERHFNTILEDDSPDEIGELLCELFRKCCEGDFTLVHSLQAKQAARVSAVTQSQGLAGGDAMDGSDDEMDHEGQRQMLDEGMAAYGGAAGLAAGAGAAAGGGDVMDEGEEQEEAPPLVDEDGFETVLVGKKKKTRRPQQS
jgi:hypothetical protein